MLLAEHLNAMYMTDSAFEARICALPVEPPVSSDGRANAVNFLRANMPEMKRATPETVAAIRRDRPELFERFQRTLVFRQSSIDRFLKLEVLGIQEIPASAARQLKMDGTPVDISSESSGAEGDVKDRAQRIYTRDVEPQVKDLQLACDNMIYSTVGNFVLVGGATFGLALLAAPTLALAPAMAFAALMGAGYAMPSVPDYLSKRRSPTFIWSKLTGP